MFLAVQCGRVEERIRLLGLDYYEEEFWGYDRDGKILSWKGGVYRETLVRRSVEEMAKELEFTQEDCRYCIRDIPEGHCVFRSERKIAQEEEQRQAKASLFGGFVRQED